MRPRLTPKGYPRDERLASLIDSAFEEAPSTGGVCMTPYGGVRSRKRWVCAEWGCRDTLRESKKAYRRKNECPRRSFLAECPRMLGDCRGAWTWLSEVENGDLVCFIKDEDEFNKHWENEIRVSVLLDVCRLLGSDLSANIIVSARRCHHVLCCRECCDAVRSVVSRPTFVQFLALAP